MLLKLNVSGVWTPFKYNCLPWQHIQSQLLVGNRKPYLILPKLEIGTTDRFHNSTSMTLQLHTFQHSPAESSSRTCKPCTYQSSAHSSKQATFSSFCWYFGKKRKGCPIMVMAAKKKKKLTSSRKSAQARSNDLFRDLTTEKNKKVKRKKNAHNAT